MLGLEDKKSFLLFGIKPKVKRFSSEAVLMFRFAERTSND